MTKVRKHISFPSNISLAQLVQTLYANKHDDEYGAISR